MNTKSYTADLAKPVNGAQVADFLSDTTVYDDDHVHKNNLMKQLLINACSNVAAIRHTRKTQSNGWSDFYDDLLEILDGDAEEADKIFLGTLTPATKGKVHTPHPTETLARKAVRYYVELVRVLLNDQSDDLFSSLNENTEIPERLGKVLDSLYTNLVPADDLLIDHEMTRSVKSSERSLDAITVQTTDAARILKWKEQYLDKGLPIPIETLQAFFYTNESYTWTPGDQDSKPDMLASLFLLGVEKNKAAMWQRDMKGLADIASRMDDESPEKDDVYALMWKMMDTIDRISEDSVQKNKDYLEQYFDNEIDRMPNGKEASKEILFVKKMRDRNGAKFEKSFEDKENPVFSYKVGGYRKPNEFQEDLYKLKSSLEKQKITIPEHKDEDGREAGFSALDLMIIRVANFRETATRIQVRQNRDRHEKVLDKVQDFLINEGILEKKLEITELSSRMEDPGNGKQSEWGEEVSNALREKVSSMEESVTSTYESYKERGEGYEQMTLEEKADFGFYQTLMTITHAIENPNTIPKYITAECAGVKDALTPLLLMKLMHNQEKAEEIDNYGLVETFPLFEHRPHIEGMKEALLELNENPHFRARQQRIQDSLSPGIPESHMMIVADKDDTAYNGDPALSFYDRETGKHRALTIADAKRMHGFEDKVVDGDETAEIQRRQTVMIAGSDSRKGSGPCIGPIIQYTFEDSFEAMLNEGVLLEFFMGCGSGKHRNYPTDAQIHTDQGANNRHLTAEEIAHNNQRFLGERMRRMAGENVALDTPEQREAILERSEAGCDLYEELYKSDDFSTYLGKGTPCHMASLISFAARPSTRTSGKEDEASAYPGEKDVSKFRAIQYGAALNGSGTCLGMWYGASKFMGLDKTGKFADGEKAKLIDLYKDTDTMKNQIDDIAYGLALADMDNAWMLLNIRRSDDGQTIITNDQKTYNIADIVSGTTDFQGEDLAKIQTLAKIDLEYQKSAQAIHEFYVTLEKGKCQPSDMEKFKPEDILNDLPGGMQEQIKATKPQLKSAREELATLHLELVDGGISMPKKGMKPEDEGYEANQDVYKRIYYPSATLMEIFEHTPAAMRFKKYGKTLEQQQEKENCI